MHSIQRKILLKLLYAEHLGYAQMRPPGVESNHFAYHLEQLVRGKLLVKQDKKYTLAPAGLAYIDRMSQEKMVERLQPHIVTAIDITDPEGKTLLYKRAFQPYIHRIGFPLGKIHYEESLQQAATRELEEKTGLTGIALTHRGMVYVEAKQQGLVISKVLYHLFQGTIDKPVPTIANHRGSCLWADSSSYKPAELMPGFETMKQLLATESGLFFDEITAELG